MSVENESDVEIDYECLSSEAATAANDLINDAAESLAVLLEDTGRALSERDVLLKHPELVATHALLAYLDKTNQERLILKAHDQSKLNQKLEELVAKVESIAASLAKIAASTQKEAV
ncbi:hypothetical protein NMYAN_40004 [Nitrosomonas nitrosa]|uniref:Uncharacterized protein n=1 Tax=Nitrosomonas nitrosa TaxID=52442 RepID=A0A8H9DA18_9PROT|nr:hypothetical protein [Nitrosomonas nitrosa]CAE6511742.1 hypothetical protein NMYAN_40004 [Nitrosomonas nitrosa]